MKLMLRGTSLDRGSPLRDQMYILLRKLIVTGRIQPGQTIDEKACAAKLGISRTPVREAIKKLSDEHLVIVAAQSGTRAARIDPNEIEQAFIIRRALEMESAAYAARNISQADIDALRTILVAHGRAIRRKDYADAIATDDQFHARIAEIGKMPRLWRTIEISKAHLDRCRHMMLPRPREAAATLQQHKAIIQALSSRDPNKARAAMAQHLDKAYSNTRQVLEMCPTSAPIGQTA
jgi:DNA-binding GntR family transcriptional regulator